MVRIYSPRECLEVATMAGYAVFFLAAVPFYAVCLVFWRKVQQLECAAEGLLKRIERLEGKH